MGESTQKYILVVDDEALNVKLLVDKLDSRGYRVIGVESGPKALEEIKKEKPGLVLLDIMMPEMDGLEVLEKIKEIDKDIPVTMVTAVKDQSEAIKCIGLGAGAYIVKPVDVEHLEQDLYIQEFLKKD